MYKTDPKLISARYNFERETSTLFFRVASENGLPEGISSGEFDVRGSIVFPVAQSDGAGIMKIEGYALLAGLNIDTKQLDVFEHTSFKSITPLFDKEKGFPTDRGMVWWFHQAWSQYFSTKFYWQDSGLTSRQYKLEVYRNESIKPPPALSQIRWADVGAIEQILWRKAAEKSLRLPQTLKDDIVLGEKEGVESVAKQALLTLLAGFEKEPWRDRSKD